MKKLLATLSLTLVSGAAMAHSGHADHSGFVAGAMHTLSGIDHVLTILAVGFLAARQSTKGRLLASGFLGALLLGFTVSMWMPAVLAVEHSIIFGLMALGLVVMYHKGVESLGLLLLVGVLGMSNGLAHGWEVPAGASVAGFATGFLLMSATLMLAANVISRAFRQHYAALAAGVGLVVSGAILAF
jgi:urease accessory protein